MAFSFQVCVFSIVRFLKVAFCSAKVRIDATFAERKASLIFRTMLTFALLVAEFDLLAESPQLVVAEPKVTKANYTTLDQIDVLVADQMKAKKLPGAVVAIGFGGQVVFLHAYGQRQLQPTQETMTIDTVFDVASLTKPIVTATSIMQLVEQGKIALDDPVSKHLPDFATNEKASVTIKQLMLHTGGLIPDNALGDYAPGHDEAIRKVMHIKLSYPPGDDFRYSDVGFIVLGELIEKVSGEDLNSFTQKNIFSRLKLADTTYLPGEALRSRAATTEQRDGHWMKGEVHDPRAFALGGVAGHAGLFSTASDLARYAQTLLNQGKGNNEQILQPGTITEMTNAYQVPRGIRGLGWDKQTGYSSNRGKTMSARAFGHGGFTGTGLWIDPELDLFVIFLSNRVHPDGTGLVNPLIGQIGTVAADFAREALDKTAAFESPR